LEEDAVRFRKPILLVALALTVVLAALGGVYLRPAEAADDRRTAVVKYLGKWNYDMPDRATMTNIAVVNVPGVPGGFQVPQIGDMVFTAAGRDRVVGRTDVGCTWTFKVTPGSLELDPAAQLCHNPTFDVSYTITKWTVTVADNHEKETVLARSHHPEGDYDFVLDNGARTRVREFDPPAAAKFTGTWVYDPADPKTQINIRTTQYPGPNGTPTVVSAPERGSVVITREYDNRITTRTDEGCTWSLLARGNTATLDPAVQTCQLASSATITFRFWTITTDGTHQDSILVGTDDRGGSFNLSGGSLSRG
jgi:hypothetical protein